MYANSPGLTGSLLSGHLIGCEKKGKLCGNNRQFYAEESDDYVENTPDCSLSFFQCIKYTF